MESVRVLVYGIWLLGTLHEAVESSQLESVQVIFRHGDRTPDKKEIYPNMAYNPIYEQLGYGQLTEKGKARELRFGKLLRERYDKFLGPVANYGDVYAVSSDYDRTKMSLQLVLRGLYPPVAGERNDQINAVPVVYSPKIVDVLLQPVYCNRYVLEYRKLKQSPIVNQLVSSHNDFFDYIGRNTGLDMSQDPILRTTLLYHLFTSQTSMGIPLPDWVTEDVLDNIEKVAILEYELQSFTPQMKRMYGGHLVKEVIDNMAVNNTRNHGGKTKIWLYSGHEINVAAFAKNHGLAMTIPNYGAAIIVEKWRNQSKEFVQFLHWSGEGDVPSIYVLPMCTQPCPYQAYKLLMEDVLPTKEDSDCLWDSVTKDELRTYYDDEELESRMRIRN